MAVPSAIIIDPSNWPHVVMVDPAYVSFNIEMAETNLRSSSCAGGSQLLIVELLGFQHCSPQLAENL